MACKPSRARPCRRRNSELTSVLTVVHTASRPAALVGALTAGTMRLRSMYAVTGWGRSADDASTHLDAAMAEPVFVPRAHCCRPLRTVPPGDIPEIATSP
jgi:hypothetical protein